MRSLARASRVAEVVSEVLLVSAAGGWAGSGTSGGGAQVEAGTGVSLRTTVSVTNRMTAKVRKHACTA